MTATAGKRLLAVLGGVGLWAASAAAEEAPKPWYSLITINAFVSTSYTWNFNSPQSQTNQYRAFDYDHNSIRIDGVELVLQKPVANPGDYGFRIDTTFGPVAKVSAARGLFRDPTTGQAQDIDLQQAFASYIVPIGHGLRFDLGKFVTPVGYELIDGYDGFNDEFSHSWLFTFGPYTHTGFKLSYPFNDKISAMVMLVNGWDNVLDNNSAKSFGVQVAITPVAPLAIYLNYIGGPERDNDDHSWRSLADVGVVYKPLARLSVALDVDYVREENGVPQPAAMVPVTMGAPAPAAAVHTPDAQWAMLVVYLRSQLTRRFAINARGEVFWDVDGNRTGTAQRLISGTITPEVHVTDALVLRAEFRIDGSDHRVFENSDGSKGHYQPTVALNGVYVF